MRSSATAALLLLLASTTGPVACSKPADGPGASTTPGKTPAPSSEPAASFTFTETQGQLLFSYVDDHGNLQSTESVANIPPAHRSNVMVVDLSLSPEQRHSDRYVYFADVTVKDPEGRFVATVVSRYRAPAGTSPAADFQADMQKGDVVVYSAEWCGYCKKTKAFLKERGVPYRERDVEKDSGADAELQAKAQRAGVRVSGVPVTDFKGELVMGFDQPRLERLIKASAGATPPAAPAP